MVGVGSVGGSVVRSTDGLGELVMEVLAQDDESLWLGGTLKLVVGNRLVGDGEYR